MATLPRRATKALSVLGLAVGLAACGSSASEDSASPKSFSVVASTNVWGDVTSQIAGRLAGSTVRITSIISDPSQDPHSYEASTTNRLELAKAKVVIENGGGYDDFVDRMLAAGSNRPTKINAVGVSGKTAQAGGELNEHVWYDFPTVNLVANKIADVLAAADAADAATFHTNAKTFIGKVHSLQQREDTVKAAHAGVGAAITEPVPLYMLTACGLVNRTPPAFSEAVEEGTDVSPRVLQQTLDLFAGKQVRLLAYNSQTSGPETEKVLGAAKQNNIPVVPVTETLPSGTDYLAWMSANLTAIVNALRSA
ncbi:MAG: metal ABC transporter solute-binding protein, Zn/Mn family [Jatrophihabitans sp.]